jgi:hypothetical protein
MRSSHPKRLSSGGARTRKNIIFWPSDTFVAGISGSVPEDVLPPDCCDGHDRSTHVVLRFRVADIPESLICQQTKRTFLFRMKHKAEPKCYAHSEVWCNADGNVAAAYENPTKDVRDQFRGRLLKQLLERGWARAALQGTFKSCDLDGATLRDRTGGLLITNQPLYQLS